MTTVRKEGKEEELYKHTHQRSDGGDECVFGFLFKGLTVLSCDWRREYWAWSQRQRSCANSRGSGVFLLLSSAVSVRRSVTRRCCSLYTGSGHGPGRSRSPPATRSSGSTWSRAGATAAPRRRRTFHPRTLRQRHVQRMNDWWRNVLTRSLITASQTLRKWWMNSRRSLQLALKQWVTGTVEP